MEENHQELQLLPSSSSTSDSTIKLQSMANLNPFHDNASGAAPGPSLDLQLSISFRTIRAKPKDKYTNEMMIVQNGSVEAMKWQAAEQIRLAAMERAYTERVRELSRREMEIAQAEFARARSMWERAREEVEKAEKLKERAINPKSNATATCMEITCNACRQKFRP